MKQEKMEIWAGKSKISASDGHNDTNTTQVSCLELLPHAKPAINVELFNFSLSSLDTLTHQGNKTQWNPAALVSLSLSNQTVRAYLPDKMDAQ